MASSESGLGGMVIGESEIDGRAVRSSVRWRLGLEVRFTLPVAVKTVRSDKTMLPVRDALCPGRESSSLRRLLLGLGLRRTLPLSMAHGEVSRGRFRGVEGVAAGDSGGVGGRNGDVVRVGSGEARNQSWTRPRDRAEKEERENEGMATNDGRGAVDACYAGKLFWDRAAFPQQPRTVN
jgi:hypothetical protein